MKLYATTTSERASKGQGGNKEIIVSLNVGSADDSREVAQIILTAFNDNTYRIDLFDSETGGTPSKWKHGTLSLNLARFEVEMEKARKELKGKQQKSKLCETCRTGHNGQKCTTKDCICTLCNIDKR